MTTATFMDHIAYDHKYKTVECGRCGEKVGYHRFLMSGICKDCAAEEDRTTLSVDFTAEHDCHTSPEDGCDICEKYFISNRYDVKMEDIVEKRVVRKFFKNRGEFPMTDDEHNRRVADGQDK